jgi:hypothetical protein
LCHFFYRLLYCHGLPPFILSLSSEIRFKSDGLFESLSHSIFFRHFSSSPWTPIQT